ncbi:Coiled-coil domain-containing protein 40 [Collichthys lucidus]|uniref:Coiled-coil domain-containing protein 40 n=1 Tax=Collichthys lucidus TaxID=240159 RepID=A0A4U5U4Z4_COLLU|nr:Coiled-coil domain-containing protein 40 [Collichthys lucidus]
MQSAGGERGGEEGREESVRREGRDEAAEECGATVPPAQEDQSGPEPDAPTHQLPADHAGANEYSPAAINSEQENVTQLILIPHFSNLNTSEDMEDQEPLPEEEEEQQEEEEEFILLDSEHLALEKADTNHMQQVNIDMFRIQEQLARLQTKLEGLHHSKAEVEAKHQKTQDQLEEMKGHFSRVTSQDSRAKANVSKLQAEIDNLMEHLNSTQGVSEDLRSNVKVMRNTRRKVGAEKSQAEEQKLKQDLYVERLTKDMERLTEQIAMYEAQASAQGEETQAAKEALSEAEMEMESLVMARKQLLQQWSSSLVGMRRRDEAFGAMQEAVRTVDHQVILLDREIEGYKRSTAEEQDKNETLTMQLNWSQMDGTTSKKLISQKQAQQEALQAHYSTCLRTLRETERTLARLSKESSTHQAEMRDQKRQFEKESAVRLELEDKIMTHMQQKLTHNKAAKYSQRLTSKIATLKKEKISQLWQLENDVKIVELESSELSQHLDSLALTQEALNEEITKYNKLLTSSEAKVSSFVTLIGQKQATISNYNKKIYEIAASTGHEDLSPLHIKIEAMVDQNQELAADIRSDKQLWMKRQGTLIGLTQEIEANSKDMFKLQTEYTAMWQKKIRLDSHIEVEHREATELEKNAKILRGDLLKLNTRLSKDAQLSLALKQENTLMETDFLHRLKARHDF